MTTTTRPSAKIAVSEANIRSAATRLLSNRQIVSTEIQYIQRKLGATATRSELEETVLAVRKLPWSKIALRD